MQKDILYLGSQSRARQELLKLAQINYQVLQHGSDEELAQKPAAFTDYVLAIAMHKMQTLVLPNPVTVATSYLYALTADTLIRSTVDGQIFGKPSDRTQALQMLKLEAEAPMEVVTGCCLEKYQVYDNSWQRVDFVYWTTGATIEFCVDVDSVEKYLSILPFALQCAGAGVVEDHGLSYLKNINCSYTAVMGLPLYELRIALKKIGFIF